MKFWLVLLVLGWRLRWLAWRNAEFRKQLENRNVLMQWRTKAGAPARWFHFEPGRVRVGGGIHPAPTVTLSFADAAYAFATLQRASKNQRFEPAGWDKTWLLQGFGYNRFEPEVR